MYEMNQLNATIEADPFYAEKSGMGPFYRGAKFILAAQQTGRINEPAFRKAVKVKFDTVVHRYYFDGGLHVEAGTTHKAIYRACYSIVRGR